jgi:putative oxidoreductase
MHFTRAGADYAAQQGVPFANVLVPVAAVLALLGGLSVLVGYHARVGAVLLALFLVPVTLMMHKFWVIADPMQRQVQQIMFAKNVSMLGATLMLMYFGAGPVSLDARRPVIEPPRPI